MATGYRSNNKVIDRAREEAQAYWSDILGVRSDLQELAVKEVELLQAEVSQQAGRLVRSAMWGVVAAIVGFLTLAFACVTMLFAFDTFLPTWLAALITTGILVGLVVIAGMMVYLNISKFSIVPKRTIDSLKEDTIWARTLISSSRR